MRTGERLTVALVAAVLLSAVSVFPVTNDRGYLWFSFALLAASALIAIGARRMRISEGAIRLLVLAPGLLVVVLLWDRLGDITAETASYVAAAYAPMEPHAGFRLLSALVLWLLYIIAEAIAVGLERPGWVFPVLVLPYLVPSIALPDETHPGYLILAAAGYVAVLATAVYGRFAADRPAADRPAGLRRGLALAGGGSLLLAWVLTGTASTLIPERSAAFLDPGQLNSSVQLGDPTLDLIRNLRSPVNRVIMTYQSEDGRGRYLRLAALPAFDNGGFHLVATDLLPQPLAPPHGLEGRPPTVRVDVQVLDFGSEWLPVPWVPRAIEAEGEWRYDPRSLSVVAVGEDRKLATRFLEYSVTSWDLQPGPDEVAAAAAGDPGDAGLTLELPSSLDPEVVDLAREVTAAATTDGERALALLSWLRSGPFTYSTELVAGSTLSTVSDFLLSSRTGYCEQFSGSMAILARAVGIPSRVVIGFLPGVEGEDGFDVSIRDMHAWTEVYLAGLGWVAFDPTPSGAPGVAPVPTPGVTPSGAPSPTTSITDVPVPSPTTSRPPTTGGAGAATSLPGWAGGSLAVLAVVAAPALLRRGRSWWRLRPGRDQARMAEDAWDELRDTTIDSGLSWPTGTPRQTAAALGGFLDPTAAAAATALALEVERARFAPGLEPGADVAGQARAAGAGLLATRAQRTRPWRRFFPRSVLRFRR